MTSLARTLICLASSPTRMASEMRIRRLIALGVVISVFFILTTALRSPFQRGDSSSSISRRRTLLSFLSITCLIMDFFLAATESMTTSTAFLPFLSAPAAAPRASAPDDGAACPRGGAGAGPAGLRICVCGVIAAGGLGDVFAPTGSGRRMICACRERSGSFFGGCSGFAGAFSLTGGAAAACGSSIPVSAVFTGTAAFSGIPAFSSFSGLSALSSFPACSAGSAGAPGAGAAASSASRASSAGRRTARRRMTVDLTRFSTTSFSPLVANSRRTRSTSLSSSVLEWDLTAIPRVFSLAMNSLFSIPNSLASSYTLTLDILETPEMYGSARA